MSDLLCFLDTETGGLDPETTSLLTAAFAIYDTAKKVVIDTLELSVRHEPYHVSAGALNVNKIDLVRHHQEARTPGQCVDMIKDFLYNRYKDTAAVLVGHNIAFDIGYLKKMYADTSHSELYTKCFSHRSLDTFGIAEFLKQTGKLQVDRCSGTHLFRHFGIKVEGRHTALGDCLATVQLFEKLTEV